MSLLVQLDPGQAVARVMVGAVLQSSVVIVLFALIARASLRRRAEVRHTLWLGVLLWVFFSPVVTALLQRSGFVLEIVAVPLPAAATSLDPANDRPAEIVQQQHSTGDAEVQTEYEMRPGAVETKPTPMRDPLPRLVQRGNPVIGGLTLLWLAGVLVGLARIVVGWQRLTVLSRGAQPLELARFGAAVERVRVLMNVAEMPAIVTSTGARGPIVAGLLRPRVVLPAGLAESISERSLCDVLVHECATWCDAMRGSGCCSA